MKLFVDVTPQNPRLQNISFLKLTTCITLPRNVIQTSIALEINIDTNGFFPSEKLIMLFSI